jgi:hypothetical protein
MTNRNEVGPCAAGLVCFHQLSTGTKANASRRRAAPGRIRRCRRGRASRPPAVSGSPAARWRGRARAPVSLFDQGARFRRWQHASHRPKWSPRLIDRFAARHRRYMLSSMPPPILSISSCDPGLPWGSPIARTGVKHALCQGFLRQITPRRSAEAAIFANCHNGVGR